MGLNQRQRVKVNAALSMIHDQGYDAQTVVSWAREYQAKGHGPKEAYQRALNEFIGGQPGLGAPLSKITRLIEASDIPTVAKYDAALSAYIATGDQSELTALAPMIARDSVVLAVKHGELEAGDINAQSVAAATGFAMADEYVTAAQPAPQPVASGPAREVGFTHNNSSQSEVGLADHNSGRPIDTHSSQSSFSAGGRVANKGIWNRAFDGNRMNANASTGSLGRPRTILQGHVIAPVSDGVNGE